MIITWGNAASVESDSMELSVPKWSRESTLTTGSKPEMDGVVFLFSSRRDVIKFDRAEREQDSRSSLNFQYRSGVSFYRNIILK